MTSPQPQPQPLLARRTSGRYIVLGMFALGLVFAIGLWAYLHVAARPFRPLVVSLKQQFPDTQVRVEGGKCKSHKQSTSRLRVIMRTPLALDDETLILTRVNHIARTARELRFDTRYELLEIYLYRDEPSDAENYRSLRAPFASFPLTQLPALPREPKS